jgi:Anti-sigma factor NepR
MSNSLKILHAPSLRALAATETRRPKKGSPLRNLFSARAFREWQQKEKPMSRLTGRGDAKPDRNASGSDGPTMDGQINSLLKSMYGEVENEGIPERFLELLEKLDEAERKQSASAQN